MMYTILHLAPVAKVQYPLKQQRKRKRACEKGEIAGKSKVAYIFPEKAAVICKLNLIFAPTIHFSSSEL